MKMSASSDSWKSKAACRKAYTDTYCSNQAQSGMNLKTLQNLMGHSDIGITMNNYTYLGLEDAAVEIVRMEAIESAGESSRRKKYV